MANIITDKVDAFERIDNHDYDDGGEGRGDLVENDNVDHSFLQSSSDRFFKSLIYPMVHVGIILFCFHFFFVLSYIYLALSLLLLLLHYLSNA